MPETNEAPITSPWGLAALLVRDTRIQQLVVVPCIMLGMWMLMVVPEFERNQADVDALKALTEQLSSHSMSLQMLSNDQEKISEHLKSTSEILDRVTSRQLGNGAGQ